MGWNTYKEFFSYAFGGLCGVVLIFLLHLLINISSVAVSLYLAFSLTQRLQESEEGNEPISEEVKSRQARDYNLVLAGIISVSLLSSFLGKWISTKIFMVLNQRLHNKMV